MTIGDPERPAERAWQVNRAESVERHAEQRGLGRLRAEKHVAAPVRGNGDDCLHFAPRSRQGLPRPRDRPGIQAVLAGPVSKPSDRQSKVFDCRMWPRMRAAMFRPLPVESSSGKSPRAFPPAVSSRHRGFRPTAPRTGHCSVSHLRQRRQCPSLAVAARRHRESRGLPQSPAPHSPFRRRANSNSHIAFSPRARSLPVVAAHRQTPTRASPPTASCDRRRADRRAAQYSFPMWIEALASKRLAKSSSANHLSIYPTEPGQGPGECAAR